MGIAIESKKIWSSRNIRSSGLKLNIFIVIVVDDMLMRRKPYHIYTELSMSFPLDWWGFR